MTLYGQSKKPATTAPTGQPTIPYVPRKQGAEGAEQPVPSAFQEKKAEPPVNAFGFKIKVSQLQQEREVKKEETQKKVDAIMAQRFQEDRRRREEERKSKEEELRRQRDAEANALVSEPAWMQALKNKPPARRY